jgi:hypothetical protein
MNSNIIGMGMNSINESHTRILHRQAAISFLFFAAVSFLILAAIMMVIVMAINVC